jgi:ubiquinone/menaquinone biosynthesis C-methylase UbiE
MKLTEIYPTQGYLDQAAIVNDQLVLQGWVAPTQGNHLVDQFQVTFAEWELSDLNCTLGMPSEDVQKVYPNLVGAATARFEIRAPLTLEQQQRQQDVLITATPLVNGSGGKMLLTLLKPTLPLPPDEYIQYIGGGFTNIGLEFLGYFIQWGGIKPSDRVLDVGCGIGRMAYTLAYYLNGQGSYEGFDIHKPLIEVAAETFGERCSNFRFEHADIYNPMYNPEGPVKAIAYRFPYPNERFNFVFLTSVFTHMRAAEVRQYLDEIHRVLKPGSRCLITCFLLNPESESYIRRGKSSQNIVHKLEECFTSTLEVPEEAIGFKEPLLLDWISKKGFTVVGKYYGGWCGRPYLTSYQDILVLQKD